MSDRSPRQSLRETDPSLFIADVHIAPDRPDITRAFTDFCKGPASAAGAVYILGDLFEVWIGDDDDARAWQPAIDALTELTAAGTRVYFMHGNRDFLVGDDFATRTGIGLLADPVLVDLHGTPTLLSHGDIFCTDDRDHQAFRAQVRSAEWRREFLARPLAERRQIAARMRAGSRESARAKSASIMDVNIAAVTRAFRDHGAHRMIHGHTHRPDRHEHEVDGRIVERWVLGDWYEQRSALELVDDRLRFLPPARESS